MQNLIILGLVPGTHIQINFFIWAYAVLILIGLINLWIAYRTRLIKSWIISTFLFWTLSHHRQPTSV
jgi:flagellar biosynthesis protein FliR